MCWNKDSRLISGRAPAAPVFVLKIFYNRVGGSWKAERSLIPGSFLVRPPEACPRPVFPPPDRDGAPTGWGEAQGSRASSWTDFFSLPCAFVSPVTCLKLPCSSGWAQLPSDKALAPVRGSFSFSLGVGKKNGVTEAWALEQFGQQPFLGSGFASHFPAPQRPVSNRKSSKHSLSKIRTCNNIVGCRPSRRPHLAGLSGNWAYGVSLGPLHGVQLFCLVPLWQCGLQQSSGRPGSWSDLSPRHKPSLIIKYKVPVILNINFCKVLSFDDGKDCYKCTMSDIRLNHSFVIRAYLFCLLLN